MKLKTTMLAAAIAASALASMPASAAPILNLYNTGVDATGAVQANGAAELHYTVVGTPLRVATSANGFPIPPWIGDNSTSAWVGPNTDSILTGPVGNATYHTTFSLAGLNPGTASINGLWATDDTGVDIFLNGVSLGLTSGSYTAFTPFTISSGFVAGVNSLDFVVNNSGGSTGLRTELVGNADAMGAVPEPATWAMMLLGFGMVGFGLRNSRKQTVRVTYA